MSIFLQSCLSSRFNHDHSLRMQRSAEKVPLTSSSPGGLSGMGASPRATASCLAMRLWYSTSFRLQQQHMPT